MTNSKKIMSELVKNFYKKRDKFEAWQITNYDDISKLVFFNGYSIFRVFKNEVLQVGENERGLKGRALREAFDEDITEYKKAESVEINKIYNEVNKKFYNCLDGIYYFDSDLMKYLDNEIKYSFYYKNEKLPMFVTTGDGYKIALILPVRVNKKNKEKETIKK